MNLRRLNILYIIDFYSLLYIQILNFISEEMCTFAMLFWSLEAIPNSSKCAGVTELFGVQNETTKNRILNRVTPCNVDPKILSSLDICKFHKVNIWK